MVVAIVVLFDYVGVMWCVVGPRLIDGRVGVEFFGVGGSRSARTLHYFALFFLWGLFFLGGGSGGLITFLAGRLTRYSLGLAATLSTLLLHCTLKIADIRKERWPSQNEPRCAINDPAMDVASNDFAVFSQELMSHLVDLMKKHHDFQ